MADQEEPEKQPRKRKPRAPAPGNELAAIPEPAQWPAEHPADFDSLNEPWTQETPQELAAAEWPPQTAEPPPQNNAPVYGSVANFPTSEVSPPAEKPVEFPFVPISYQPEIPDDTVRQSGLAWSTGVVFFCSVAFMLFLGWGADLLFGSSPWGIVIGVVLGSIIGFIQFFRISSQIYAPKKQDHRPFLSDDDTPR